ncbi:MAG: LysR family transcriptional regulator [Candidatus Nucleicultricaceae bacterium]
MDWNKLQAFYHVVRKGSFTHAAESLKVNQSSLSRHVIDLEQSLNIQLLYRSRLGISLTPKGSELYNFVARTFEEEKRVRDRLHEANDTNPEHLRLAVAKSYDLPFLTHLLNGFLNQYKTCSVTLDNHPVHGQAADYDAYIGPGFIRLKGYIKQPIYSYVVRFYASKKYLERQGVPQNLHDLQQHRLLICEEKEEHGARDWLVRLDQRHHLGLKFSLSVNSLYLLLRAVEADLGIAALRDDFIRVHQQSLCLEVLENYASAEKNVYLTYHESKATHPTLKLLRHFVWSIGRKSY